MKKIFYSFLILVLVLISCNKPPQIHADQDVVFKAKTVTAGFKTDDCTNPVAHYAIIDINGIPHYVDVFYLNGIIYTNTLKLTPGSYVINSFILMNDANTPGDTFDDVPVQATPVIGSSYENFVQTPLPLNFTVDAFFKTEINIEILCFEANEYSNFGFAWLAFDHITIREICFFGNFCTKYFEDYSQSLYAGQRDGLRHDMPAIFKIDVWRNQEFMISYNNENHADGSPWLGDGAPLCVKYPDSPGFVDEFEFVLSILVKVGLGFQYVEFHTWTTTDADPLPNIGSDNIMDFVLGACGDEADLHLPPYMNLPFEARVTTGSLFMEEGLEASIEITLSDIGAGFDIDNITYGAYCADLFNTIHLNKTYWAFVYSSMYPELIPAEFSIQAELTDNINWLANNLYRYDGCSPEDFQFAIWKMIHPIDFPGITYPPLSLLVTEMVADALAYGNDYLPPVGGLAGVYFVKHGSELEIKPCWQMLFINVDP